MPEKSGFFDSTADDIRAYPARDFAEYFARLLTNGVFNGGTNLEVTAAGNDANVRLNVGYAWINGYVYSVYDSQIMLSIEPASTMDRIDRVVLRLDTSIPIRAIRAIILQGAPNTNPTAPSLVRSGNIYDISLAQIRVKANTTIIQQSNITDERLDQNVCGLVNSLIRVDTATFQRQWDDFIKSIQDQGFATTDYVNSRPWQKVKVTDDNGWAINIGGQDLNTPRKTGWYMGSGMANAPGPGWYFIEVIRHNDSWEIQNAYDFNGSGSFQQRKKQNGIWTAWTQDLFTSVANGKNDIAAAIRDKGQNAQGSDSFQQLANAVRQISTGGRKFVPKLDKTIYPPLGYSDGTVWTYHEFTTIPPSQNYADLFADTNGMKKIFNAMMYTNGGDFPKYVRLVLIDEAGVELVVMERTGTGNIPNPYLNKMNILRNQREVRAYQYVGIEANGVFPAVPSNFNFHGAIRFCAAGTYVGSSQLPYITCANESFYVVTT